MLRDVLSNKWVLGGFGFLIVLSIACVWWYGYTLEPYKQQADETQRIAHEFKLSQESNKPKPLEINSDPDLIKSEDILTVTETINNSTSEVVSKTTPKTLAEIAATLDHVKVSPFGLGAYPEAPADYPNQPINWDFWGETLDGELMSRVRIKLWKQGIYSEGASFVNGKVYPTVLGTVYVRWDANRGRVRGMSGHPDDDFDAITDALNAGHPPPDGITVLDFYDNGIEPYSFLELNK